MRGILVFYYLGGAGGKFIANCLTYSQQVAFTNYAIALRNNPAEYNQELLKTVPDREHSRQWLELEHGCSQLFGTAANDIKMQGSVSSGQSNDLDQLGDVWVPIVAHYRSEVDNIMTYFQHVPTKLIIVDAVPEFIDLAIRLKWADPSHCLDLNRYREFKREIEQLKAHYVFEAWNPLNPDAQEQIVQFAQTLNINLDLAPAQEYIARYLDFHR